MRDKKNKSLFGILGVFQVTLLIAVSLAFAVAPANIYAATDNRVIVQLKTGQNINTINQSYGSSTVQQLSGENTYLLNPGGSQNADSLVTQMQSDTRLVYSETNYSASRMKTNPSGVYYDPSGVYYDPSGVYYDPSGVYYDPSGVYYDPATGTLQTTAIPRQYAFAHIRLNLAHQISKGAGVIIAVVDSGVYVAHPMLAGRITPQRYNAVDGSSDVSDPNGHGTFIAGILAQVAPEAKIMPVKVLGADGYGEVANVAAGIRWAADNGANIINVSLGTYYDEPSLKSAVEYATYTKYALVVASVGNDNSSNPRYPASYLATLSVGSSDQNRKKASFSNYGLEWSNIRVVAPGTQLRSLSNNGGFTSGQGTSFSTPIVAGLAALYWSKNISLPRYYLPLYSRASVVYSAYSLQYCDIVYGSKLNEGLVDAYQTVGGPARSTKDGRTFYCDSHYDQLNN